MLRVLMLCAAWLASQHAGAHRADDALPALDFVAPAPGTYQLHRIMPAVTLLGFIYTTCVDPDGCPLAYRVFDSLKTSIHATPDLGGKVRFVTLSFDPARDTPTVMARYAGSRLEQEQGLEWYFLTTRSVHDLLPLVEGFGQDVRYSVDKSSGKPRRELSHVLKVFLIDRLGDIREIYSSAFLHPQTVMNDIKTLLMERQDVTK